MAVFSVISAVIKSNNSSIYAGCKDATVVSSKVANYHAKDYPELEDFGDATLIGDNGATNYFRVDWLTPNGLGTWGDGRTLILGTEGYIELRKYIDIARDPQGRSALLGQPTRRKALQSAWTSRLSFLRSVDLGLHPSYGKRNDTSAYVQSG